MCLVTLLVRDWRAAPAAAGWVAWVAWATANRLDVRSLPDGLFGQCQGPRQERVQYQLSVPVLQRLQEVLKRLMLQGEWAVVPAMPTMPASRNSMPRLYD